MQEYSTQGSIIDKIINLNEDSNMMGSSEIKPVPANNVPNLQPSSYEEIKLIGLLFEGKEETQENNDHLNKLPVVEVYSEFLKNIGRKNKALENKQLAKSKLINKNQTYQDLNYK